MSDPIDVPHDVVSEIAITGWRIAQRELRKHCDELSYQSLKLQKQLEAARDAFLMCPSAHIRKASLAITSTSSLRKLVTHDH